MYMYIYIYIYVYIYIYIMTTYTYCIGAPLSPLSHGPAKRGGMKRNPQMRQKS